MEEVTGAIRDQSVTTILPVDCIRGPCRADPVVTGAAGQRSVVTTDAKPVIAVATEQLVLATYDIELVVPVVTKSQLQVAAVRHFRVVARQTVEYTAVTAATGDHIIARAADRTLDDGIERDADIVDEPADRRIAAGAQIDHLVGRIARAIEGILAAGVVDGERGG